MCVPTRFVCPSLQCVTALLTAKTAVMSSTAQEHVSFPGVLQCCLYCFYLLSFLINFRDFLEFIEPEEEIHVGYSVVSKCCKITYKQTHITQCTQQKQGIKT